MEGIVYGGITRTGSATTVLVQRYDSSGDGPDNGEGGRRVNPSLASNDANTLSNVTQTNSMNVQRSGGEIHQDYATATMTITSTNDSGDTDGPDSRETLGGVNSALNDSSRLQSSDSVRDYVVLRLAPTKKKKKKGVQWSEEVIDNEGMNKKKSKKCCIFHKQRAFGEWSDDEDSDSDCDHCHHNAADENLQNEGCAS